MSFHTKNRTTGYELAAINGDQRIFIACVYGSRSRATICDTLTKKIKSKGDRTRFDLLCDIIGDRDFFWGNKAIDGLTSGDWCIRFTHRTGLDIDREGTGPSIYDGCPSAA